MTLRAVRWREAISFLYRWFAGGEHVWTAAIGFSDYRRRATDFLLLWRWRSQRRRDNLEYRGEVAGLYWRPFTIPAVRPLFDTRTATAVSFSVSLR
ncbi:hypothetical protein KCP73_05835 [Salmonella enterica subsp. enterica]|nr:hypothetical protein KCP73_05835 [Salmonella enterica subsp. enterica]